MGIDMEQTTPANVVNWYDNNREHYADVQHNLRQVRRAFGGRDIYGKVDMLQKAHAFAVLSIQTPVHIHEQAYENLFDSPESIADSINSVNYYKNKASYIRESFRNRDTWREVARLLKRGNIDEAHKHIVDTVKGVSTTKAAFMLAMLGFTSKMCIDSNMCELFEVERSSTVVVEKYENSCKAIRDTCPTLRTLVSPFLFQWICFDYQRRTTTMHDTWFDSVL